MMDRVSAAMYAAFERVFSNHGYDLDDYHVEVVIFSEANQVIVVCDHRNHRHINLPVEDNVINWPWEKLAGVVVEGIDDANMEEHGYI